MEISKIQYITNYQSKVSHVEQAKQVLEGGLKWIQYRPKNTDLETVLKEGAAIAELCRAHKASFIMNDQVEAAVLLEADGVHLGKSDMHPEKAREILGEGKIIGGTANTFVDIISLVNAGVDYIGLGPFRFTETKAQLSPILGLEAYKSIFEKLKERHIELPIVAIGGIRLTDIVDLQNAGTYGIAISSLLSEADDIYSNTQTLLEVSHH